MDELLNMDLGLIESEELANYDGIGEFSTGSFQTIPDGEYICKITKIEAKISEKNKTPFINIWTNILDGDYAGQNIFVAFYFSEKAKLISAGKVKRLLNSFGFELSNAHFASLNTLVGSISAELLEAIVEVKQETKKDFKNYTILKHEG